jgi:hypothetical protein
MTETSLNLPVARQHPGIWLARLTALVALLVLVNLAIDSSSSVKFGWDVRVNCAAVDAHIEGLDPYIVDNLKGTKLSYPYLPVTLDIFRPLCSAGFLAGHYRGIYLVLAVLCGLLLPGLDMARGGLREALLRVLCALGAFVGFEWTLASGNFTIFSGLLTAVALALLLGRSPLEEQERETFLMRLAGAAVLGLLTSFKLVFFPVLAALYFLPQPRHRKFILIAVAAGAFILPILISMVFYADLFPSWLSAVSGKIPGQHSVALDETNPSLLILSFNLAEQFGLVQSKPIVFALYGLAVTAFVLAPFALSVSRAVRDQGAPDKGWPLERLDRWLMDHPHDAARITVLAMYALYLCSPRLKEYAFFELAIYAAVLIVDLPSMALAAFLAAAILIPTLASISGSAIEGTFAQLIAGLVCFWILLADFRARPRPCDPASTLGLQS